MRKSPKTPGLKSQASANFLRYNGWEAMHAIGLLDAPHAAFISGCNKPFYHAPRPVQRKEYLVVISVSPVTTTLWTVNSTLKMALSALNAFWKFSMPLYRVTGSWKVKSRLYFSVLSLCSTHNFTGCKRARQTLADRAARKAVKGGKG